MAGELQGAAEAGTALTAREWVLQQRAVAVLQVMPYAVPFDDRLRVFEMFAKQARDRCQPEG